MASRIFLILLIHFGLSSCTSLASNEETKITSLYILQGRTTSHSIEVSLIKERSSNFIYRLGLDETLSPSQTDAISIPDSHLEIVKLKFDELASNQKYPITIRTKDGKIVEQRIAKTFPENLNSLRFVLLSCADDAFIKEQQTMWDLVHQSKPDVIFAIGDNVYATRVNGLPSPTATPETLWKRYLETRQRLAVYRWTELIPVLMLWDDHDYGQSDGDRNYRYKTEALHIYKSFAAQSFPATGYEDGPAASWKWLFGQQEFYFLDGRSFRSPNSQSPACFEKKDHPLCKKYPAQRADHETRFGSQTEDWLFKSLDANTQPAWMFTGDQWFGRFSPFESYEGNAFQDFQRFLARLKPMKKTLMFGSGDRHATEFMEIEKKALGYTTYEITSSSLHGRTHGNPWIDFPNPRKLEGVSGLLNFALIQSESVQKKGLHIHLKSIGPEGQKLYDRDLHIQDSDFLLQK